MELSCILRNNRNQLGLTQQQVAEKIGVDKTTYAHYESGRRTPNTEKTKKLCEILNLNVYDLLGILPIESCILYTKNKVSCLEETIEKVNQALLNGDSDFYNLHLCLKESYMPLFDEKMEQLGTLPDMITIIPNITSETETQVVHLDLHVEHILNKAIKMDLGLLSKLYSK